MIDYFAHVSALRVCQFVMATSPPTDLANPKAVIEALNGLSEEPGSAILGALVDTLLQYSEEETSAEIGILRHALVLFEEASTILKQIGMARASLEAGMTTPTAPGVLAAYNAALSNLPGMATELQNLRAKLETFQANFSGNWMAPMGQQRGAPVSQWAWRDVFLGRRTTAFVANVQTLAATAMQRSFSVGVLAGAAGNLLGSGYLNSVVGGPRRSHQLRHRLAAYSVGAWLRDNEPQLSGTLAGIHAALHFGQPGPQALPSDLRGLIQSALLKTYPSGTPIPPNLDVGYNKLVEHLKLLGAFTLPPVPQPMNNTLTAKVIGLGLMPGTLKIEGDAPSSGGGTGGGSGGGGQSFGNEFPGFGSHEDAGSVCATIFLDLSIIALLCFGVSQTGSNYPGKPGTGKGTGIPGPAPSSIQLTLPQLKALSVSPEGISTVNSFYGLEMKAWGALAASCTALVLRGLLYPDPGDLSNPTFTQFQAIPGVSKYPLLPMPPADDGTAWPTTALEQATTSPSPYPVSASPLTFLTGSSGYSVSALSSTLWEDMIEQPGSSRTWSKNFNLDSDRGFLAECWELAPNSAITSEPVDTVTLSFTGI